MNCSDFRSEIEDARAGAPVGSEAASVHLRACSACRAFRAEHVALKSLLGELEKVEAPSNFEFRVRARVAALKSVHAAAHKGFAPDFLSIALAACFVLTAGGAFLFKQSNSKHPAVASSAREIETALARQESPESDYVNLYQETAQVKENARPTRKASFAREAVARNFRSSASTPELSSPSAAVAQNSDEVFEVSFSVEAAPIYTTLASGSIAPPANSSIAIPLDGGAQELELRTRDDGGVSRKMLMRSVSFGAQEFSSSANDSTRRATPTSESVW